MPEGKAGPRPTIIVPPARPKPNNESAPAFTAPAMPPASGPTAMRGVARKRIEASASDLQALSPGVSANVCKKALELIASFVEEKANERKAIVWGHELQKSYSEFVSQTLTLAQDPVLERAQGYLKRMMEILRSIDLLSVCGHGKGGIFEGLTRSVNDKIDTPDELRAAKAELDQLVVHMNNSMKGLLDFKDTLEKHSGGIKEISVEVEASALAALFLSNHLRGEKGEVANRFEERSMSLTQTLAQIRQNDQIQKIQVDQPIKLIGAIQNVALVMMPGLMGSIASLLTMLNGKGVSPTEAGEVNYQLQNVLNKLT